MNGTQAYEKVDATIFLNINNNEDCLKFGIDQEDKTDCESLYELIDCMDAINYELEILKIIKSTFTFRNALQQVVNENSKVFPKRHQAIKKWLESRD